MENDHHPVHYKGVMVSSTFTDLTEHRAALIRVIDGLELKPVVMENDGARPDGDVIDSSLGMVRDASAYVCVISRRYGQIPEDSKRNPDRLSLTELEFNEARRLGRPILLFIMGEDHPPVKAADHERDPENATKLEAFRENAKRREADSSVDRVYKVFNSLPEFAEAASLSVAHLRRYFDAGESTGAYSLQRSSRQYDEVHDRLHSVRSEVSLIKVQQRMKQAGYSLESGLTDDLQGAADWYRKTFHDADVDSDDWNTRMAMKRYLDQLESWARQMADGSLDAHTLFGALHDALPIDTGLLRIAIAGHQAAHTENPPYTSIRDLEEAFAKWKLSHGS